MANWSSPLARNPLARRPARRLARLLLPLPLALPGLGAMSAAIAGTIYYASASGAGSSCTLATPCSLTEALSLAVSGTDTVTLAAGTYPNTHIVLAHSVTLQGSSANPASTVLDGGGAGGSVVMVDTEVTAVLSGLTIQNGSALPDGGGINNAGTLTVTNSIVSRNKVGDTSLNRGGGILNATTGTLRLMGSSVLQNSAHVGGGISNSGTVTVMSSLVGFNSAFVGGGISNGFGPMTVANSSVSGNQSTDIGAGIENEGPMTVKGSLVSGNMIVNCTFVGEGEGGGIANFSAAIAVTNSTVSDNSNECGVGGGGIFSTGGSVSLTNSTVSDNSVNAGGVGAGIYFVTPTVTTLANTVIANNAVGGTTSVTSNCAALTAGLFTDLQGNLEFPSATAGPTDCGLGAAGNILSQDPLLGPLQDNGGPIAGAPGAPLTGAVPTQAPAYPASPAIGLGLAATCLTSGSTGVNDVDERGLPRYAVLRGKCDSGAYDTGGGIVPPLTVTGAIPLTAAVPARLGFAASNHAFFIGKGVAGVPPFNIGYITFQQGANSFVVRQRVAVGCTPDHCAGTTGLVNGLPGFVAVTGATLTLSGPISSARGAYPVGATATVTLSLSASPRGMVTIGKMAVSVAGVNGGNPVALWAAPFPAGSSVQVGAGAPLIG